MGTRGTFGVIIGEQPKMGYNQFDSYPDGKGLDNLRFVRSISWSLAHGHPDSLSQYEKFKRLAGDVRLVSRDEKPTARDKYALRGFTDLGVSEQSKDDWYCLTRDTHGSIELMLRCGYILDSFDFGMDSLFCEWGYVLDFDNECFDVYSGFQASRPTAGLWAGRPTPQEAHDNYVEHLKWCAENKREPWETEEPKYYAIERVQSYSLRELPSDEEFLDWAKTFQEVDEEVLA